MYLIGNLLQCAFTLGSGLSRTGTQILVTRGLGGVASSFCLPAAVSIVTNSFAPGRRRSIAFASMGAGLPVGFAIGLILGGVCGGTIGWQWSFHITAMINFVILVPVIWQLPRTSKTAPRLSWRRFGQDTDWIGVILISAALSMLLYVLA